ncbi:hypothetical protein F511_30533 [Dorcoceras hygrometricum]|uniref:Uncharacterized protein n=1 Tax=Dorcoceras hygrometricum TaxID=472368 RepID=A0A2Z7CTY7_9LAMI|nr:hypothetical protein F511_30533 [Dorcoceras hygrometricum]
MQVSCASSTVPASVLSLWSTVGTVAGSVGNGWTLGLSSRWGSGQGGRSREVGLRKQNVVAWGRWVAWGSLVRFSWYQSGGSGGVLACCVELESHTSSLTMLPRHDRTHQDDATPSPPPPPPQLTPYERARVDMLAGITRLLERQSERPGKSDEEDVAERFCKQGPKEFAGTTDPLFAEEWI